MEIEEIGEIDVIGEIGVIGLQDGRSTSFSTHMTRYSQHKAERCQGLVRLRGAAKGRARPVRVARDIGAGRGRTARSWASSDCATASAATMKKLSGMLP